MRRNPPERYFSAYARGRTRRPPGLIQSKAQRRVARLVRKTRRTAAKHRYDWIPDEGIAPGQNPRGRKKKMAKRRNLFGFGKKSKAWRIKPFKSFGKIYGYQVMHGSRFVDEFKTKREADAFLKFVREKERSLRKRMKSNPKKKRKSTRARARRRPARRRNARRITFPIPVTPKEKKKVGSWLRRHFGKRIKVR
jgi:hypothetical protein